MTNKSIAWTVWTLILAVSWMLSRYAGAAPGPQKINFQGKLLDTSNNPRNGSFGMTFSIYGAPSGGSSVWTEEQTGISVSNGVFTVELGAVTPLSTSLFAGSTVYLGVKVGTDAEMTPRQALLIVPVAFRALLADDLVVGNTNYVQVSQSLQSGAVFHVSSGTVAGLFTATGVSSFTASGAQTYSIVASSGIRVAAGTLRVEGSGGAEVSTSLQAATLKATSGILLPQGGASTVEGELRWEPAGNLSSIGTGTGSKTLTDTDSTQSLTNKTLSSTGGNTVDATHLQARLLSAAAPENGMTLKWNAGASRWEPFHVATISVIASPFTPSGGNNATEKLVANNIYLTPIVIPGLLRLNHLRFRVTTIPTTGGNAGDVGLYDSFGVLVASGGASSANFGSAGAQAVPVQGGTKIIQPGQYYMALTCNGNPRVRGAPLGVDSAGVVKGLGSLAGGGTTLPSTIVLSNIVDGYEPLFLSLNE